MPSLQINALRSCLILLAPFSFFFFKNNLNFLSKWIPKYPRFVQFISLNTNITSYQSVLCDQAVS
ncbi:unnamed protein product [Musa acuminata subsp. malaccensis]|uniref:(wild Malaysian banana) hypothetical protein n=1 Tax=Musa acuminata subsp. malaccensis TaxID=214687 RepID=A0A804K6K3_MUSAM|nr:unnamed protein product [Musa acuminata subsp. malaccensis]